MFFEDFIKQYDEQLSKLKEEYSAKEAALASSNAENFEKASAKLQEQFNSEKAKLEQDFTDKLAKYKSEHEAALRQQSEAAAQFKAEREALLKKEQESYAAYKQGVATREEFAEFEKKCEDAIRSQDQKVNKGTADVRQALDKVSGRLNELNGIDAESLEKKIRQCNRDISDLREKKSGGGSAGGVILGIVALLAAAAVGVLLFLGIFPMDKYGYAKTEAVTESEKSITDEMHAKFDEQAAHIDELHTDPCAAGHSFNTLLTIPATEEATGYQIEQCGGCKEVKITELGKIVHGRSEEAVPFKTEPATLVAAGMNYYHCDMCGREGCEEVLTEEIPSIVPAEYLTIPENNRALEAAQKLAVYGTPLSPDAFGIELWPELVTEKNKNVVRDVLWFITNDGRYLLITSYNDRNSRNTDHDAFAKIAEGTPGSVYKFNNDKYLFLIIEPGDAASMPESMQDLSNTVIEANVGQVDMYSFLMTAFDGNNYDTKQFGPKQ